VELGAFSISLSVSDLEISRVFYAKLGFETVGGDAEQNWLILKNGTTMVGLFQGMFEGNILTFNPGFGQDMSSPESFTDVREIASQLDSAGLELRSSTTAKAASGPASFTIVDPDGNAILIDQHR
jgi:lactoylglutathione lyase